MNNIKTNFKKLIIFLIINFGALGLGGLFTNSGVASEWYQNLNKAPWTPPGWVFGAAWTSIMICLAIFMTLSFDNFKEDKKLLNLFIIQIILNILWNPLFFHFKYTLVALICISLLLMVVGMLFKVSYQKINLKSLLIAPYLLWLIIATSLNAYVVFMN